jgi:adenosylcobyric acid synthase
MTAKMIMVQGTASSVGKSILVSALCRMFYQDGFKVAPFKAQNMALNSFVTLDGGEIARSTAVQAEAARTEVTVDMNPILLKPEADSRCQVIVHGRPMGSLRAVDYYGRKSQLWSIVTDSLERLSRRYDVIVIEGAGSPAEINLRDSDIVNMRVALEAKAPVLLVGDIDRGGVFASLVGTLELLSKEERDIVKAFVINKFRGDISLLKPGLDFLENRTGIPVAGVVPYYNDIQIAEEDSVALERRRDASAADNKIDIAVIRLPHVSNFDDFDALENEADVSLRYASKKASLGNPDLIIIPGTKTTVEDLEYLRSSGLAKAIIDQAKARTPVIGICGGYQMLGQRIFDPQKIESERESVRGLGLLPLVTVFEQEKSTFQVSGKVHAGRGLLENCQGQTISGYEIHMGRSQGESDPVFQITSRSGSAVQIADGSLSEDGQVFGTYIHGVFDNEGFRRGLLAKLAQRRNMILGRALSQNGHDLQYDRLADHFRYNLDMDLVYNICCLDKTGEKK